MTLEEVLLKKKTAVLKRWFNLIAQTYPDGGASLRKNKDRFTNPVGYMISSTIADLYDALLQGELNSDKVSSSLNDIIKVRAVQDFSPSQASAFVFLLKKAVRAELEGEIREARDFEELSKFESKIDDLGLRAFDIYIDCREKVYQVKVNEMKAAMDNAFRLLERQSRKDLMCHQSPGQVQGVEREMGIGYNTTELVE